MHKCPPTGGVHLQEVSVSGGSTVGKRQLFCCSPHDVIMMSLDVCIRIELQSTFT